MLCTIAGLDPTGGAGIAADLRTFAALGGWGTAVVTAIALQDEGGVRAVHPVAPDAVRDQLRAALARYPAALKTGMLATANLLAAVADVLDAAEVPPLVVDPVLAAGAGGALLEDAALAGLAERLAPHATLLTPNLPEAARLLDRAAIAPGEERAAATALLELGWQAVLLKGGHGQGATCIDHLVGPEGAQAFSRPRLAGPTLRGTGCTLASAIAAHLGRGMPLADAVEGAGDWLHEQIARAHAAGARTLL